MDYEKYAKELLNLSNIYQKYKRDVLYGEFGYELDDVATIEEVQKIEEELQVKLPNELKEFFLNFTKDLYFFCPFNNQLQNKMTGELKQIAHASLIISLQHLYNSEMSRRAWIENCYNNPDNPYDKVYYNKLAFMSVGNGDLIAFDLQQKEEPKVVYLSHDDHQIHGYTLGNSLNEFLDSYLNICLCGLEAWQFESFINDSVSGIVKDSQNAKILREIIYSSDGIQY